MTPKEKAKELKYKMENFTIYPKRCALIAVDEMLKENLELPDEPETVVRYLFWQEVKQEIENL